MKNKFRFVVAFVYYKIILFLEKITGRGDKLYPSLTKIALKLCPDFLARIGKPNKIICVTGTNGKTSTCGVIKSILELDNKTVINNTEWSMPIGISHTFAKNVNLFNKTTTDYAIIEMDELKSIDILSYLKPDYIIVTNIFRDTLKRNAYPLHIFDTLNRAISMLSNTKVILNADDPISSFIRENNFNNVYYSIKSDNHEIKNHNSFDFPICPKCFNKIKYEYIHYLHLGKVYCPNCGFKSIEANFKGEIPNLEKQEIVINENEKNFTYPLLTKSLFNAFNSVTVISLFRTMGYEKEKIKELLGKVTIPKSRGYITKVKDITIYNQMAKGQNVSATSSVFEYMSTIKEDMELILVLDDIVGKHDSIETLTWFYDSDFEFLNTPYIKKIIVGSNMCHDYEARLLIAGIPKEKFVCVPENEITNYLDFKNNKNIYLLYDSYAVEKGNDIKNKIVKIIEEGSL